MSKEGTTLWGVYHGGTALTQGKDGNIIGIDDCWNSIDIVSPDGTLLVNRTVPELVRPAGDEYARYPPSVIGTSDGGYAACGAFGVVKLDSHGNVTWKVPRPNVGVFTSIAEMDGGDFLVTHSIYPGPIKIIRIHAGKKTGDAFELSQSHSLEHRPVLKKDINGVFACYQGSPGDIKRNVTLTPVEYYEMKTYGWICHRLNTEGTPQSDTHIVIPTTGPLAFTHNGECFTADTRFLDGNNTPWNVHATKLDTTGPILWDTTVPIDMWIVRQIVPTTDGGVVVIGLHQHHH